MSTISFNDRQVGSTPSRPQNVQAKTRSLEQETKVRDKNFESHEGEVAPEFYICRRRKFAHFHKIHPDYDRIDLCLNCKEEVVYDRRQSEGIPHICVPCAESMASGGFLSALHSDKITGHKNDADYLRIMEANISQAKSGENRYDPNTRRHG
jgi:hypothetical protein